MDAASVVEEPAHHISKTAQGKEYNTTTKDSAGEANGMTLDERAIMLATAVTIDFDYFSKKSGLMNHGWMPIWFPWGVGGGGENAASSGSSSVNGSGSDNHSGSHGGSGGQSGSGHSGGGDGGEEVVVVVEEGMIGIRGSNTTRNKYD